MFLRFYGLTEQPFGVTPDPRFLYLGPAHQEAFASLVYGIDTGRGFMALIAPPGLGKTTLILRLMEKLRDSALTAFLFQTHADSKELLKNLLLDLEAEPSGQDLSDLQAQLRELLIRGSRTGKRLVVVIDEAQNLDESVLEMVRMLSNFETPEAKLLQIVLAGQPALADKLAQPELAQLRQRISIITHFPLLRGDEVENYIQHRLRVAGYKGGRLFAPGALALIAKYSRGVPRVINNVCFHALSLGYAKSQRRIDVATLREVIADLNLESLGRLHQEVAAPARQAVKPEGPDIGGSEKRAGRSKTAADSVDIDSRPIKTDVDLLDSVEFSDYTPDWTNGTADNPRYAPPDSAARGSKSNHRLQTLAVLAVVAVVVLTWRGPWLGRSLDFVEQELWGASTITSSPSTSSANDALSAQGPRLPEPRRGSSPSPALTTDVKEAAQKAMGESPVKTSRANLTDPPDAPPQTADTVDSRETGSNARRRLGVVKGTDALGDYGGGGTERDKLLPGKSSSADDLGVEGARGKLVVQSSLRGAQITVNGRHDPTWVTPHMFSLVAGTYIVSVSMPGYTGWAQRTHVDEGRDNWLMAQLTSDETGVLTVETEPPGMQVYIDGRPYGASRVVTVLPAGWHVCEVIPPAGIKPLVGRFHLEPGEALTKRIQVTTPNASSAPVTQAQRAGRLP